MARRGDDPEIARKLITGGLTVLGGKGCGEAAHIPTLLYEEAGVR